MTSTTTITRSSATIANRRTWLPCHLPALIAALSMSASSALADVPVQCAVDENQLLAATGSECCSTLNFACGGNPSQEAADPVRLNVLLAISDDQNYCNYSFMAGHCADDPTTNCWNDRDCSSWDECVGGGGVCSGDPTTPCGGDADCGAAGPCHPLRLSDPSCRHRQPPREKKNVPAPDAEWYCEPDHDTTLDNPGVNAFPFNRSNVPCSETRAFDPPVTLTPHLDRLAARGVVFTQARVGGNTCKAARSVILRGKPHRHLQELVTRGVEEDVIPSVAYWLEHTGTCSGGSKSGEACRVDADCGGGTCAVEQRCIDGTHAGRDCTNDQTVCGTGMCDDTRYRSYLVGKGEVVNEEGGGFDGGTESKGKLGKFECPSATVCKDALDPAGDFPGVPNNARTERLRGARRALDFIFQSTSEVGETGTIVTGPVIEVSGTAECEGCEGNACAGCRSKQVHPFLLWWAPKLPHAPGKGLTGAFDAQALYDQHYKKAKFHLERVSQFDVAFGALLDELNRSCVCVLEDGVAKKKSLLDNTIVLFLTDHGRFLPMSKGNPTDNNHRTPLVVSLPGHRDGTLPTAVYRRQMAHSIDVLRTVLSQAGIRYPLNPAKRPSETAATETAYPFARDLSPCLHGDATNCPAGIRQASYGEDSSSSGISSGDTRGRYIIVEAPGVCTSATTPVPWVGPIGSSVGHAKPCYDSGDCGAGSCDQTTNRKRCINDPTIPCATTSQCIVGLCSEDGECAYDTNRPRSFGDRAGPRVGGDRDSFPTEFAACTAPEQCIPCAAADSNGNCTQRVELCQPVRLKVEATRADGRIGRAWDLDWDPDETRDLLKADPNYLGATFKAQLKKCLDSYWQLAGSNDTWTGGGTYANSACAWAEPTPNRDPYVPPSP